NRLPGPGAFHPRRPGPGRPDPRILQAISAPAPALLTRAIRRRRRSRGAPAVKVLMHPARRGVRAADHATEAHGAIDFPFPAPPTHNPPEGFYSRPYATKGPQRMARILPTRRLDLRRHA